MALVDWIKRNKLAALLLLILAFIIGKQWFASPRFDTSPSFVAPYAQEAAPMGDVSQARKSAGIMISPPTDSYAPAPEVSNRLVLQDSYLSLLVSNVRETTNTILAYTQRSGGYMVNSSLTSPGEAPNGTLIIRIPARSLNTALEHFRGLSIKVVSENLTGQDVTDQYVDNDARLQTLMATKAKFEDIFNRATEISDIVNIQQQLINLQSQIDAVKGQQQYLEKSAQMAKMTIYLSTDELALPYAPQETWRANVIFKYAVRSLVGNIRSVGTLLIWVMVYSIIWIPALFILWKIKKRIK